MVKPSIKLTALEKTAIHTPTQGEYKEILRVFDCGGWMNLGLSGTLNFSDIYSRFSKYGDKMCVDAGNIYHSYDGVINISGLSFYKDDLKHKIITPQEFYKIENIPDTKIREINYFFDKNEGKKAINKEKVESDEQDFIDPWELDIPEIKEEIYSK